MVNLLRRREMVLASGGGSDLLYSLSSYTVTAGTSIDTDVAPFRQGVSCTIVCDIKVESTTTTSGRPGAAYKLFRVYDNDYTLSVLSVGKSTKTDNYINAWWMGVSSAYDQSTSSAGRKKFIVTHESDSNSVVIYDKLGSGSVGTKNLTQTFVATNSNLFIGSWPEAAVTQQLPSSTINRFEVYNRIWTQSEIDTFFA